MADHFKPRVVLFLGAGINKPLSIPTSGEFFFDKCYEKFKDKDTFFKIADEIKSAPENADLEKVLIKIENARIVINESALVVNRKEAEDRLKLGDEIHRLIHEKCSNFDERKCLDHYSNLLINLTPLHIAHLAIFTTNYDRTVESFFRNQTAETFLRKNFGGNIAELWDGFVKAPRGGLIWRKWGYRPLPNERREGFWDVPLYKMHGSVGWINVGKSVIEVGSDLVERTGYTPLLIFPGVKGLPEHEICRYTRQCLLEELERANCVCVIGFSFRDDYIAEIFEQALNRNPNLTIDVIAPGEWPEDSKIHNYSGLRGKIQKHSCYFGKIAGQRHTERLAYNTITKRVEPTVIKK